MIDPDMNKCLLNQEIPEEKTCRPHPGSSSVGDRSTGLPVVSAFGSTFGLLFCAPTCRILSFAFSKAARNAGSSMWLPGATGKVTLDCQKAVELYFL